MPSLATIVAVLTVLGILLSVILTIKGVVSAEMGFIIFLVSAGGGLFISLSLLLWYLWRVGRGM